MEQKHLNQIEDVVVKSIEKHINGDIRDMKKELRDYIKIDTAWKKEADPYIKGLANISGFARLLVWVSMGIGTVAGAILALKKLL